MTEVVPYSGDSGDAPATAAPEILEVIDENWMFLNSNPERIHQMLRANRRAVTSRSHWSDLQYPLDTTALIQRIEDFGYAPELNAAAEYRQTAVNSIELLSQWRSAAGLGIHRIGSSIGGGKERLPHRRPDLPDIGDAWLDD